jgi:hypothetical protein
MAAASILFSKPNVYYVPLLAASIQKKNNFNWKNVLLIRGQGNEMIFYRKIVHQ